MVALYKFMPISPRSNQIPPLATRQPLRFSWWRRSTFSGFLLKQLSYLLLATFLFVPPMLPVFAGRAYVPSLQYWTRTPVRQQNIWRKEGKMTQRRQVANTDLWKDQVWSSLRMLLLKFYELAVQQRRGVWGPNPRCPQTTINCPLMPPIHTLCIQ